MPDEVMVVPRAFLLEVAACHRHQTKEPLLLITTERISQKDSAPAIGKGIEENGLEPELCTDAFVLDMDDSLRLMLGLAKVRAAHGCGISQVLLDQYGARNDGSQEQDDEESSGNPT